MDQERYYHALVIDDEEDIAEYIAKVLETTEFFRSIIVAKDYQEAQQKLTNQSFDIIFLDIGLPNKSGLELLTVIQSQNISFKRIIIASGQLDKGIITKAVAAGVSNFLAKPLKRDRIVSLVDKILSSNK